MFEEPNSSFHLLELGKFVSGTPQECIFPHETATVPLPRRFVFHNQLLGFHIYIYIITGFLYDICRDIRHL